MSKYEIHPLAAMFAAFDEEEMATTVESIRRDGLRHKICVVRGRIVDGVNREKACELAGVEPVYEELSIPEEKIGEFILAQNVARRHMNKGQQAVFVALVHPEPEKGGRGKKSTILKGFSLTYLSMARELVRLDRARAERVLKERDYSLDQALRDAKPEPEPKPKPKPKPERPKPTSVEPAPVDPGQAATEAAVNEALQQDGSAGLSDTDRQRMENASIELQKRLRSQHRADMMAKINSKPDSTVAQLMAVFDLEDMTREEAKLRFPGFKEAAVRNAVQSLIDKDLIADSGARRKGRASGDRPGGIVYRSNPYPRLPMGHPDTACAADAEHDQGLDGEEPWIAINYAADWQESETLRMASEYALFRDGVRQEDFNDVRVTKLRKIADVWLIVANRVEMRVKGEAYG
jgi:hypothetical protein